MRRRSKNIGKFLNKVTIQSESLTQDGAGGWDNTWTDVHSVWADIEPSTGSESLEAEQLLGKSPFKFTMRYSSEVAGIDNQHRIKWGDRYFNIHSVVNLNEEKEFLEVMGWEDD